MGLQYAILKQKPYNFTTNTHGSKAGVPYWKRREAGRGPGNEATQEAQYEVPCEVNFHLQLALVLRVLVLYL